MSENVNMNNQLNILQNNVKGKDFSGFNGKIMNEISLFQNVNGEEQFNEKLTNKDDFVSAFQVEGNTESVSAEQMSQIYDMLDTDGDGKVSENELKLLASLGGEPNGNKIDVTDIVALANLAETGNPQETQQTPPAENMPEIPAGTTVNTVLKNDERIQQDANGQKFVTVESWSDNGTANDCLEAIVANSYDLASMGIKVGSSEYNALLNAVMDANPQIYGTAESGWREEVGGEGRNNAVLYDGDNIVLPNFQYVKQAETQAVPQGYEGEPPTVNEGGEQVPAHNDDVPAEHEPEGSKDVNDRPSWADFQRLNHESNDTSQQPSWADFRRDDANTPFKERGYNATDVRTATRLGHYVASHSDVSAEVAERINNGEEPSKILEDLENRE